MLNKNYFELFGLANSYQLDTQDLAKRYRRLQQEVHPDRYANGSAQEKRIAMQQAAHVNSAYQHLKQPLARGLYLLELSGHALDEKGTGNAMMDPDFLFAQMALREHLEQIPTQAEPIEQLEQFMTELEQAKTGLYGEFSSTLAQQHWESAQELARKLQFYDKLHEESLLLEERLFADS